MLIEDLGFLGGIRSCPGGAWHATGPAISVALARQDITVLRLTRTAHGLAALLAAGTGPEVSLLAAWSADGQHWILPPPLRLNGAPPASVSFGSGSTAAIIMNGNRADMITSAGPPRGRCHRCPSTAQPRRSDSRPNRRPRHADRLAAPAGGTTWANAQAINVPMPYGALT